jgi:copper resistance protein D
MEQFVELYGLLAVFLRGAVLIFQTLTIGGIVFLLVVVLPARQEGQPVGENTLRWIQRWAWALSATVGLYVCLDGLVLSESSGLTVSEIVGANFVAAGILGAGASLAVAILATKSRFQRRFDLLVPTIFILAASTMTSHSIARLEHRPLLALLTALHQGATAAWIGGLPYLLIALRYAPDSVAKQIGARFSRLAMLSVSVLVGAGVALAFVYLGSANAVYVTTYGFMVTAKLVLFGLLLALGGLNFRLIRRTPVFFLASLQRFGEAEIGIGFATVLLAASLTSLPPAADTPQQSLQATAILARLVPHLPQVNAAPLRQFLLVSKMVSSEAANPTAGVGDSAVLQQPRADSSAQEPRWMDDPHHWAALIVFPVGLLAFLARTKRGRWAQNWPLLFVGLGLVLLLLADEQYWPLGHVSFWSSFVDPVVLPHRIIEALIGIFGVFEWRVQTGRVASAKVGLVFPMLMAVSSALLLTHVHSVANAGIQQDLIPEFSHLAVAILGTLAGWSRWLELRLPSEDRTRRVMPWIWPVCILLVGVVLAIYRES